MIQIRRGTFETNSSSTHALCILTKEEYNNILNGKGHLYRLRGSFQSPKYKYLSIEEYEKYIEEDKFGIYEVDRYFLLDDSKDNEESYIENNVEVINENYTTKSGDELIVLSAQSDTYQF